MPSLIIAERGRRLSSWIGPTIEKALTTLNVSITNTSGGVVVVCSYDIFFVGFATASDYAILENELEMLKAELLSRT
jgi:hypothetical protein